MSIARRGLFLVLPAAVIAAAPAAWACGGFFCNNVPIEQAGEKILFVMDEGHVTAHIQIQYTGPSEEFSWVVPTTVVPDIGVGTDEIFPILANATNPYVSQTWSERNCPDRGYRGWYGAEDAAAGGDADADSDADYDGGVTVIQSSIVGPFETVTLDSEDPQALLDWLDENGYVIPAAAEPIVAAYVASDSYFVGLKLTKDAETGDLQPIVLDMDTSEACVPLRLTAIAATEDMPVYVWFVGEGRAVSTNFPEVVVDDVLLHHPAMRRGGYYYDGETYVDPYVSLVSDAVDAAGGLGFVTDYAGASWPLIGAIRAERYDTRLIGSLTDPQAAMDAIRQQGFTASQLVLGILLEFMPPPAGVEARDFYNCPSCYDLTNYTFDSVGLAGALEARIAAPLREIQSDVARHTHLTRLFTTISPNEMTQDPFFGINPSLPLVDRMLEATVVRDCRGNYSEEDDYQEITTEAGHRFCAAADGSGEVPDVSPYDRLVQYGTTGAGEVIEDRTAEIDAALSCGRDVLPPIVGEDVGLCTATPGGPATGGGALFVLVGLALLSILRRTR